MSEKTCPITKRKCLADCRGVSDYCWIRRAAPVIVEVASQQIKNNVDKFTQMESIPEENRERLAKQMAKQVKVLIKRG